MKKKILSCLLAMTLGLTLFVTPAIAAPEITESEQVYPIENAVSGTTEADMKNVASETSEAQIKNAASETTEAEMKNIASETTETEIKADFEKTIETEKNSEAVTKNETLTPEALTPEAPTPEAPTQDVSSIAPLALDDCPTPDEAYQRMIDLQAQYPEGTPWTDDNFYAWNGGGEYYGGYGCSGFAMMLSDAAFGNLPSRKIENVTIDQVHSGDYMRVNSNTHSVMVMQVFDDHIVLAEGNYNSSVHWGRTMTADEVANADYILTRYPLGYFGSYYSVTFNANGGNDAPTTMGTAVGSSIKIPAATPNRMGHEFLGWATSKTATKATYQPGDTYTPTKNVTLYAVWKVSEMPTIAAFPAELTANITAGMDNATYLVTPDETCEYRFESRATSDTTVTLYDMNGNMLGSDDDSGAGTNFRLDIILEAGKSYLLAVEFWSGTATGELPFVALKTSAMVLQEPLPKTFSVTMDSINREYTCYFTPKESGSYTFESTGSLDTIVTVYTDSDGAYIDEDDDSGSNQNFRLTTELAAGEKYRIIISSFGDANGTFTVTVRGGGATTSDVRIVTQPHDAPAAIGDKISFSVSAENAASYLWQYSKDNGVTWVDSTLKSATKDTINITVSKSNYENIYRCVLTGKNGSKAFSKNVCIALIPWAEIIKQPESQAMLTGETIQFHCEAENADSYQWQYSKDGSTWKNSTLSTAKTPTLSIKVSDTNSMNIYRCQVTGVDGNTVNSSKAVFVLLTQQPEPCSAPLGTKASYTIKAENAASYQWQYSKDGGKTWVNSTLSSAKTDTLTFTVAAANQENLYRCKMKTTTGVYAYTKPVGYVDELKIVTQPTSKTVAEGKVVYFKVAVTGKDLTYQWQYSKDGGKTWTKSTLSTATTASLKVTAQASQNGRLFCCVITDGNGQKVTSAKAKLTVTT